ncbi:MAG TPA: MFS transporter [Actinopolymorphaceae bacterium]
MTRTTEPTPEQTTEPQRSRVFWRRPGSVFANRDYLILLIGQTISGTGASMGMFVFPLVALQITGSTVQAGLVGTAAGLAQWLLGLPAGALVDRWPRRRVMLASEGTGAVLFGSLVVASALGHLTLAHLLVVAFGVTAASLFFGPAENAALPLVVTPVQLPTALAANQARQAAAALIGSPAGGALLAVGRAFPFVAATITYSLSWISLLLIRTPLPAPPRTAANPHLVREIREGLAFVWANPFIRVVLIDAAIINLGVNGLLLVVNLHLYQTGVPPVAIGAIDTIAGIAAIVGSTLTGSAMKRMRPGVIAMLTFWGWALACIPIPLTDNVVVIGACIAVGMLINPVGNAALLSYRAVITPDRLQGRSLSAIMFVAQAAAPIAPIAGGWLLAHKGHYVAMYGFVALLVVAAIIVTVSKAVREVPMASEWGSLAPVENDGEMTSTDAS